MVGLFLSWAACFASFTIVLPSFGCISLRYRLSFWLPLYYSYQSKPLLWSFYIFSSASILIFIIPIFTLIILQNGSSSRILIFAIHWFFFSYGSCFDFSLAISWRLNLNLPFLMIFFFILTILNCCCFFRRHDFSWYG